MNALAEELRQSGANVLPVPADLTDAEAVTKAFALVRTKLGPVSIQINHVGSGVWGGFNELTAEGSGRRGNDALWQPFSVANRSCRI